MFILAIFIILLLAVAIVIRQEHVKKRIFHRVNIPHTNPPPSVLDTTDKIIWSYWSGAEMPLSVKLAIFSWKQHNPTHKVVLLNEQNIQDYIDINTFPQAYPTLEQQHKADVVRLAVLERYGGYWCDATYYVTKPLADRWEPRHYDVGGYYQDMFTNYRDKPVLENWFLAAPKDSALIRAWKLEFYRGLDYKNPKRYIRDLEKEVDLQGIPVYLKTYLMMHCAFLKVIATNDKYRIKVYSALKNGPFDYMDKFRWKPILGVAYLIQAPPGDDPPEGIKLRGGERGVLEYGWWLYRSGSLLDKAMG